MTIASIPRLALTAEHGLGVDAQVDAVCIFMAVVATILAWVTGFANLFFSSCLFHSSSKGLRTGETCRAGQTVVTRFGVLTAMDSVMCVTSVRDCFTLINVFAGDAVSTVAKWTLATFEGAIGEADAFCPREAWVGETSINRAVLFVAHLRHSTVSITILSSMFGNRVRAGTLAVLDSSTTGNSAGVPW